MSYNEYCGHCAFLDLKNKERYGDKYYCDSKRKYVKLTDKACYDFMKNPDSYKNNGSYTPSGCYITTIVCDILGYEDNCELLNILRNFRDTTLKADINYLPLLLEYDKVGPVISEFIRNSNDNYELCLNLTKNFLIPCVDLINNKKVDEAVQAYQNMVVHLHELFNLPAINININEPINIEILGKGRILAFEK